LVDVEQGHPTRDVVLKLRDALQVFGQVSNPGRSGPCDEVHAQLTGASGAWTGILEGGLLRFDGVPPGPYTATYSCSGGLRQRVDLALSPQDQGRTFEWPVDSGIVVEGVVAYPDGPLDRAVRVSLAQNNGKVRLLTGESGDFQASGFEPGEVMVEVEAASGGVLLAPAQTYALANSPAVIALTLDRPARLTLACEPPTRPLRYFAIEVSARRPISATRIHDGNIEFEGLPVGEYKIMVSTPGSKPVQAHAGDPVPVVPGQDTVLECLTHAPEETIEGRVLAADGSGVIGAAIWLVPVDDESDATGTIPANARSGLAGAFAVGNLLPGQYQVEVRAPDGGSLSAVVSSGEPTELVLPDVAPP
jgi:hypothetical protein